MGFSARTWSDEATKRGPVWRRPSQARVGFSHMYNKYKDCMASEPHQCKINNNNNVMGNWERINMPDTIFNEHLSLFINSMFITEKIVVRRSTFSTIDPTGVSSNLYYHFRRFRLCMVALVAQISACSQDIGKYLEIVPGNPKRVIRQIEILRI